MKCSVCKLEVGYQDGTGNHPEFWWRGYPDLSLCRDCWAGIDELRDDLIRLTIARRIKIFRLAGRDIAARYLESLRGCGVPLNAKRLYKKLQKRRLHQ